MNNLLQEIDGYKTYAAALALLITGVLEMINAAQGEADNNLMDGWEKVMMAAALVGVGHKIDKSKPV